MPAATGVSARISVLRVAVWAGIPGGHSAVDSLFGYDVRGNNTKKSILCSHVRMSLAFDRSIVSGGRLGGRVGWAVCGCLSVVSCQILLHGVLSPKHPHDPLQRHSSRTVDPICLL